MLLNKIMKMAEKMGLDVDQLLEMKLADAILLVEDTAKMWVALEKSVE